MITVYNELEKLQINPFLGVVSDRANGGHYDDHAQRYGHKKLDDVSSSIFQFFFFSFLPLDLIGHISDGQLRLSVWGPGQSCIRTWRSSVFALTRSRRTSARHSQFYVKQYFSVIICQHNISDSPSTDNNTYVWSLTVACQVDVVYASLIQWRQLGIF